MKPTVFLALLFCALSARADFSYTTAPKTNSPAATATKYFYKGQAMRVETKARVFIVDFDKQSIVTLDPERKVYWLTRFADVPQPAGAAMNNMQIDFKDTGATRTINGFNAHQFLISAAMDMSQMRPGAKMNMEMEIWVSPDVPGASEMRKFYERNAAKFPWGVFAQGNRDRSGNAMVELQRKMASMNGVPVEQIIHVTPAGGDEQAARMQQQMAAARARLEEMAKQGGRQGEMAQQALARMGGASGASLMEMTIDSQDFSTASIPASLFEIPSGYTKSEEKQ